MNPFNNHNHNSSWTLPWADFITTLLGIFLLCFAILLINVKVLDNKSKVENNQIVIEASLFWTINDVDVDLWGEAPNDVPVGYSNKNGKYLNLLRDDLGYPYEAFNGNIHFENMIGRTLQPGEYRFNAHMFYNRIDKWPVHVKFILQIFTSTGSTNRIETEAILTYPKQEITLLHFKISDDGTIDRTSINNDFVSLATIHEEQQRGYGGVLP